MTVRSVILEQITRVGEQQRRQLAPLTDSLAPLELMLTP